MNKSWKSFDLLLSTPSPVRRTSRTFQRGSTGAVSSISSSSRAIAQLKPRTSISPLERRQSTLPLFQTNAFPSDETQIEDIPSSDEENQRPVNLSAINSAASPPGIEECSAPSLDPKDVTICDRSRIESDIEDVSEPEVPAEDTPLEILETSSDDSDCEAIHCKRNKRLKLDFVNRKSPRCGRRITDDIFTVENATERAISAEKSSTWIKPAIGGTTPKGFKITPKRNRSSVWKRLDESFTDKHPILPDNTAKSPLNRKWKTLDNTFREKPPDSGPEIESDLTPENLLPSKSKETSLQQIPETSFYDPTLHQQWPSRIKYRKDCPLSRFQQILLEKSSIQTFWLHERQMGLLPAAKQPVYIESIGRIFGRIAISYYEPDDDEPDGTPIEHILYVDPSEKQLKSSKKGSRIEVEYDLAPHKLSRRKIVHLGVCKIKAVD